MDTVIICLLAYAAISLIIESVLLARSTKTANKVEEAIKHTHSNWLQSVDFQIQLTRFRQELTEMEPLMATHILNNHFEKKRNQEGIMLVKSIRTILTDKPKRRPKGDTHVSS